jgi:FkbM family methyltransferase
LRHAAGRRLRNFKRERMDGFGHDFVGDIRSRLPHLDVRTIFDVGAHIGMTAIEFSDEFPRAVVYAFEPHPGNMARMRANLSGKPDVRSHQIGLGEQPGELPFHFDPAHPSMARIASHGEAVTDIVAVDTIDLFAAAQGVRQIDLLKIDVEGHEMAVLRGASGLLSDGNIAVLRIESAADPDIKYHTQFPDLCEFLHPLGYRLFGFYDQNEFPPEPANSKLRRFDVAFISPTMQRRPSSL